MAEMDNVSIKVIEDARGIKNRNIQEAEEKAAGIISDAAKEVKKKTALAKAGAREHYKKTFDMEVFKARSTLDQKVLLVKLGLVEDVIEKAKERLLGLDKKGWEKFLRKMASELSIDKGSYVIGRQEKVLDDSIARTIKGIEPDEKKADFDRGMKITSGKTEIFLSPSGYLDMDVEDLKMKIASHLFGGGQ